MTFRVRIDPVAQRHIDDVCRLPLQLQRRIRDRADRSARPHHIHQSRRVAPDVELFHVHGRAPYRAYLFRVGRRTQYWIIYTVDEETRTVDILSFWSAARDPRTLDL